MYGHEIDFPSPNFPRSLLRRSPRRRVNHNLQHIFTYKTFAISQFSKRYSSVPLSSPKVELGQRNGYLATEVLFGDTGDRADLAGLDDLQGVSGEESRAAGEGWSERTAVGGRDASERRGSHCRNQSSVLDLEVFAFPTLLGCIVCIGSWRKRHVVSCFVCCNIF